VRRLGRVVRGRGRVREGVEQRRVGEHLG
jgi:hypothetical protein